jgi:NAD+ kinase
MKFGVVGNPRYDRLPGLLTRLAALADDHGITVCVEDALSALWPGRVTRLNGDTSIDLLITFGGDGTLLRGTRLFDGQRTPVLGVNLGRVGFLTGAVPDMMETALSAFLTGEYRIESRSTLETRIVAPDGEVRLGERALNDVVVHKAGVARVIHVIVEVDGEPVGQYSADGIIVATPTGSTAYSLSAGGPVVVPDVDALVITAICPHTLAVRPIVVRGDAEVTFKVVPPIPEEVLLSFDGQVGATVAGGDRVTVVRASDAVQLVRVASEGFFARMRSKLQWGDLSDRERA